MMPVTRKYSPAGRKDRGAPAEVPDTAARMLAKHLPLATALLLAVATVVLYLPVRHHPFLNLDDNQYVTENPHVQDGLTWPTVKWAFTSYYALNWHPLTWLSHAADVQMFGADPAGPHLVNLLLHVLNVVLLFLVLQRATGYTGRSAMVAGLLALHPINVESVAWLAERKNLLSMLFFLLALGAYRRYATAPDGKPAAKTWRYVVVAVCFALGLIAKPQIITLPFVLLLWDYWPLQRMSLAGAADAGACHENALRQEKFSWLALEKVPLLVLCAGSALLTMQAQGAGGAVASFVKYPLTIRLENALVAYVRYLAKALWPSNLTLLYPHPGNWLKLWQAGLALVLLFGITELVLRLRRRYLLVGWLWFLGTLVPMIGIVQVGHQAMADRYAYLPFIGLFIMVCWGVPDLLAVRGAKSTLQMDTKGGAIPRTGAPSWSLVVLSAVVLLALALATHRQLEYWSDNLTLWAHVRQVIGPNLMSEERMGDEMLKRGEPARAMPHFLAAIAIKPNDANSHFALGVYEQKRGHLPQAIQHYQIVAANAESPQMRVHALTYMSYAYRDLGDSERARASLQAAEAISTQQSAVSTQP